jgi:hypothetical protein
MWQLGSKYNEVFNQLLNQRVDSGAVCDQKSGW